MGGSAPNYSKYYNGTFKFRGYIFRATRKTPFNLLFGPLFRILLFLYFECTLLEFPLDGYEKVRINNFRAFDFLNGILPKVSLGQSIAHYSVPVCLSPQN